MRYKSLLVVMLSLAGMAHAAVPSQRKDPVDWVDLFIGTGKPGGDRWYAVGFASLPRGMVKLCPDTTGYGGKPLKGRGWMRMGYNYNDDIIEGFSHLHSVGLGGILVIPTVGDLRVVPGPREEPTRGYSSKFRHETEVCFPGYYAVTLDRYNVRAEITATMRVGLHRYTFPQATNAHILFDIGHQLGENKPIMDASVVVDPGQREVRGSFASQNASGKPRLTYFVASLDRKCDSFATWQAWDGTETISPGLPEKTGKGVGVVLNVNTRPNEPVLMKVAVSHVSLEQARLNMSAEAPDWDFEGAKNRARTVWNQELSKVEVEGGTVEQKKMFYSAMYRLLLGGSIDSDVNGYYRDMEDKLQQIRGWQQGRHHYQFDSIWAYWWGIDPVLSLIDPRYMNDLACSVLEDYRTTGVLPRCVRSRWGEHDGLDAYVMIGAPSTHLLVSCYMKGISDFDVETAYQAMLRNSLVDLPEGFKLKPADTRVAELLKTVQSPNLKPRGLFAYDCQSHPYFEEYGYLPHDRIKGSASKTLEHAYAQWALSQMAKALGKKEDYQLFHRRAGFYKNLFNPQTTFMEPRLSDGSWLAGFNPDKYYGDEIFVEGKSWHYTWYVPHDLQGLVELMGGAEALNEKLNRGFEKLGTSLTVWNEPYRGNAWVFNYSGAPWLTQKWVRAALESEFGATPLTGYRDDDDEGQYSGWYVNGAIGLHQQRSAALKPLYEIASPIFDKITIHLGDLYKGRTFVIETKGNSRNNLYIQSARLNGKRLNQPWFYHSELAAGGALSLELGPEPNKAWGSSKNAAPLSMTDEE